MNPVQTSWELIDVNKNASVINASYAGSGQDEEFVTKIITKCLEPTTYKFTIFDSFEKGGFTVNCGDGNNCGNENGCYRISR